MWSTEFAEQHGPCATHVARTVALVSEVAERVAHAAVQAGRSHEVTWNSEGNDTLLALRAVR